LGKPGKEEEKALPSTGHSKGPVRGIAVLKERLGKKRQIPVGDEKDNNEYHNTKS
jgi:CHAD domain-containing protein